MRKYEEPPFINGEKTNTLRVPKVEGTVELFSAFNHPIAPLNHDVHKNTALLQIESFHHVHKQLTIAISNTIICLKPIVIYTEGYYVVFTSLTHDILI